MNQNIRDVTRTYTSLFTFAHPLSLLATAQTREEDLDDAFRKFGALTNVKIVMDSYLNRPKGYGFVKFEKQDDADAAKEAMDGAELMGRNLKVDRPTAR